MKFGYSDWEHIPMTLTDCQYEAVIRLMPTEGISSDAELARMIKKNPFMTKEAIHDFFMKRLRGYLDDQFEVYS